MRFQTPSIIAIVACVEGVLSAATNFHLYAYGTGLPTGLTLFYGNGLAYVSLDAPSSASNAANVIMSMTGNKLVVSADSVASQPYFYIGANADGDNLKTVGFASTPPPGAISSGFGLFGGGVYSNQNTGSLLMNFVATPTNEKDVYLVKWNAGTDKPTGTNVPISLRTEAPIAV
ncbi:hypothetical protein P153DRAFT_427202 [Dothidotthia symphoricarpi CBS 119687]|uniref:Uncharacterized protein n=1 Tax=Dothidotthia symphoricarpi CBS 119687 TaxID=1392245 RepID=A0A6A6ARE7_9PLEO|nr:uncharacterized protein P153DRAFT_427202 [Dothidotthia symphoricarpi CBS 119687]KAF2134509.1 hypothetical protein P153DRAFT_427202 [Dothidotthia symphoricarpi CBS 119687]